MDLSPSLAAVIVAAFLLAGLVKGAIGLGLPSIAIGLLAIVMPPAQAAALLIVPSLVTNVWQMLAGPAFGGLVRRLWPLLVASAIGTWIGGGVLTGGNSRLAAFGLGLALIVYGALGLSGKQASVPRHAERWLAAPVGLATGLITGATGVFVLPAGPYFQAIGLDKDDLVQALGLSFTVSTLALAAVLLRDGVFQMTNAAVSIAAIGPAVLGMIAGQALRQRVSAQTFRVLFFAGIALLGLVQAVRNLPL